MLNQLINSLLPTVEHTKFLVYWIAFFGAFTEAIVGFGFLVPGSLILLVLGSLATRGMADIGDLAWFAVVGAVLGDNFSYELGKRFGKKWIKGGLWFLKPRHIEHGKKFIHDHGAKSVFFARFFPTTKETVPFIAGSLEMKRRTFMLWEIFGSIGWSFTMLGIGYTFSGSLRFARTWLTRAEFFIAIAILSLVTWYLLKFLFTKYGKNAFAFTVSVLNSIGKAIIENAEIQKFSKRHKSFFSFLHRRLRVRHFHGLPLTIFLLLTIYLVSTFLGLSSDIVSHGIFWNTDLRVANLLYLFRREDILRFFLWVTLLGKWQVIMVFSLATLVSMAIIEKRRYLLPFFAVIFGNEATIYLLKRLFDRPRPELSFYTESSPAFPSGHSGIAVVFYGFLLYIILRENLSWKRKINVFFLVILTVLLVGFSRIYLGVHYLSDVAGGYLIGSIWLILGIVTTELFFSKKLSPRVKKLAPKRLRAVTVTIFLALIFYIGFALHYRPFVNSQSPKNFSRVIKLPDDIFITEQMKYTETLTGRRQEPISFIIKANGVGELIEAFEKSGWILADHVSVLSIAKLARAVSLKNPYPSAPMTPSFWNMKTHLLGFEKATMNNTARERHHARFWDTGRRDSYGHRIFVGTASLDTGMKWGITHRIAPDIDTERERIFHDLSSAEVLSDSQKLPLVSPVLGKNFTGDPFFTDGEVYIVSISSTKP